MRREPAGALVAGSIRRAMTAPPNSRSAYVQSVVVVALCTLLAWQMSGLLRPGNLLMVYLIGTVFIATRLGQGPSIVAALLSVAIFDFLLVPPRFRFALSDVEYLVTSGVLVAVVIVISSRSARLREQAIAVRQFERQAAAAREAARTVQIGQLQGLAAAALAMGSTLAVEDALRVLAEQAREIVGAHLSIAQIFWHHDGARTTQAVSVSELYARWKESAEPPSAIVRVVSERNRPLRMTREELGDGRLARGADTSDATRSVVQAWLAVPLVGQAGRHLGAIFLGDKQAGEFSDTDEAILVQLAQIAAAAVEKAWLYQDAERRRQAAEQLNAMSHDLATTRDVASLLRAGLRHIGLVFQSRAVVLLPEAGRLVPRGHYPDAAAIEPADAEASQWVYEQNRPAGLGTTTFSGARTLYLPLVGSRETIGVLELAPDDAAALLAPGQLLLLETFANHIALAVERATLAEQAQQAHLRMETERLRSSLLSSISHDLRTPLAAITGAASSLLWRDEEFDPKTRRELKELIYEEAERLARLVENLLDMTRLESGIKARKEWQPLEEVVGAALARLERRLRGHAVTTRLPRDLPLVPIDDVLIEQVLINLLDNAVKYTDPEREIDVSASTTDGLVTVDIADRGPGIEPGDEERVFEKFYRGEKQQVRGAGLGLAICRGIIQAHGGRIWAENRRGGGAVFHFTLPTEPVPAADAPNA